MGMTAFEVFGVLKLDTKDFDNGLGKAKSSLEGLSKANGLFNTTNSLIGNGLATAAKVGVAAITGAASAVAGFAKTSLDTATSFETAFTGVRKTVEEEYDGMYKELEKWIMQESTHLASTQEEIAGVMEIAGQLGVTGTKGLETFTETIIKLGDTTDLTAEEAATALARFGNIAHIAPEEMDRIGAAIVDLGNHSAALEPEIVAMATRLASAGTIAGLSATDILGLSTAMTSVGIQAEAGGTAMSTILTKIGRAVDEGVDPANEKLELFARTAGMSSEQFATAWKTKPAEALTNFIQGLDGVIDSGGNVTAVLDDLGIKGIREANTVRSLALASDMLVSTVDRANKAYTDNLALEEEAATRYEDTAVKALQTANAYRNLKKVIGDELKPTYGEFLSFTQTAIEEMQKGLEEGGIHGLMQSMGTAIAGALDMLNSKLPEFIKYGIELLGALGQGIMDNLDTITATASEILVQLANALAEGLPEIIKMGSQIVNDLLNAIIQVLPTVTPLIVEFITGLAQIFADNAEQMVEIAIAICSAIGEGIIQSAPIIAEKAPEILNAITSGIEEHPEALLVIGPFVLGKILSTLIGALDILGPFAQTFGSSLGGTLSTGATTATAEAGTAMATSGIAAVGTALTAILGSVMAFIAGSEVGKKVGAWLFPDDAELYEHYSGISGTFEMLKDTIDGILWLISETWNEVMAAFVESAQADWEETKEIFASVGDFFEEKFNDAKEAVEAKMKEISDNLKESWEITKEVYEVVGEWFKEKFTEAKENVVGAWSDIKAKMSEVWGNIKSAFDIKSVSEWGRDMISNFVDGIRSKIGDVMSAASDIAETVRSYLHFSEPDVGPLADFSTYAPDMMKLFAQGMKENQDIIQKQFEESFALPDIKSNVNLQSNSSVAGITGGMIQNITINAPTELDPSEIARQTKNASREMMLRLRMA